MLRNCFAFLLSGKVAWLCYHGSKGKGAALHVTRGTLVAPREEESISVSWTLWIRVTILPTTMQNLAHASRSHWRQILTASIVTTLD